MIFTNGEINAVTFLIDRPGGFTEVEIAGLKEIAHALGIVTELQASRATARSLMDTYLGRRTGERVLAGAIRRGSGETIRAVIWYCDLRGFTALVDRIPLADVAAMLNEYFEIMAGAVMAEGGEVLKFIGDGMLAIFDLCDGEAATRCCAAALRAAGAAAEAIAAANVRRAAAGAPEIHFGLALHLGEVYYGNIGALSRLDFTVIGPAVNQATRLEKLGSELGHSVVTSASFAAAAAEPLTSLGLYQLRGVAQLQEIFAPPAPH
jgi:adenylate cyclase